MNELSEKMKYDVNINCRIALFTFHAFHPKALNDNPDYTG